MKRVAYHRLAAAELVESALFYDCCRPGLGEEFLSEVDVVLELIKLRPECGRQGNHGSLSLRVKRFPFRVIYDVHADRIWVVAVAHLSRRPGYWTRRLRQTDR